MLVRDEYIINHKTQALLHYKNSKTGCFTIVKEVSKTLLVKQSPVQIIKQTQQFHNFTIDEPKRIKKVNDMIALTIAPYLRIGLCPTTDHVWILESHIKRLEKILDGRMMIYFTNERVMTLYPKRKERNDSACLMDVEHKEQTANGPHFLKEDTTIQYTIRFKARRKK